MASIPISPQSQSDLATGSGKDLLALSERSHGYVDVFGYSVAAGGWLFCGWVPRPSRTGHVELVDFNAKYDQSEHSGQATVAFYEREDLDRKGVGVVAFLPSSSRVAGDLQRITISLEGFNYRAHKAPTAKQMRDQDLIDRMRIHLLNHAFATPGRDKLLSITSRTAFSGQDTLTSLSETVVLELDEAIFCPPDGVLLLGWQLSSPGSIRAIRVRSGHMSGELSLADSISVSRPDVISTVMPELGFSNLHCGFIAYVSGAISRQDAPYLEVELASGEIGFKKLRLSKRAGMSAIRRVLALVDLRFSELVPAFDRVLGPAIRSLNAARLVTPPSPSAIVYGDLISDPKYTLIVPLYGRVDFIEYQMALFSQHAGSKTFDIIYVLDDPSKRRELESLAQSTFERFRIPFRLLLLPENLGFAPTNNVGLKFARGQFVCFLNSDIFPITQDWMERLVARIEQNPAIGVVGARLLFEDGSVQHEGCFFRRIPEFGNWTFVEHQNKGRRPTTIGGLRRCEVITGACMVMKRALAQEIGGFDETFIIGDFEDSDLCLRVRSRGLHCVVDRDVHMYHLERKSQSGPGELWRLNLTLYNAWVHQQRWFSSGREAPHLGKVGLEMVQGNAV